MSKFSFNSSEYTDNHEWVTVRAVFTGDVGNSAPNYIHIEAPEQPMTVTVEAEEQRFAVKRAETTFVEIKLVGEFEFDSFINGMRNMIQAYDLHQKVLQGETQCLT
jgi:hypothetical protein